MSHTIDNTQLSSLVRFVQTTIVNYTQGGEAYTAAEFAVNGVVGVLLGQVPASANSLGVPLFPILDGGKVKLFQFSGGSPAEIPTTNTLNAVITALIWSD